MASHPRTGLAGLTDAKIQRRTERLTRELDVILDTWLSPAISAGASEAGGGIAPVMLAEHNRRVDRQMGRSEIESELGRLARERARRRDAD